MRRTADRDRARASRSDTTRRDAPITRHPRHASRRHHTSGDAIRPRPDRPPAVHRRRRPRAAPVPLDNRDTHHARTPMQLGAQRLTRARQPRLDRAHRHAEGEGDLVVAQPVDLSQHQRRALVERQRSIACQIRAAVSLLASSRSGSGSCVGLQLTALLHMIVERHQVGPMAPAPPALAVSDLIDDDAVDPGSKRRTGHGSATGCGRRGGTLPATGRALRRGRPAGGEPGRRPFAGGQRPARRRPHRHQPRSVR